MVARGVLGDDLTLEGCEGVGEKGNAPGSGLPLEAGESVRARWGRACDEPLVLEAQHVHAEAPRPSHARPGEGAAGRAERDQGRLERDRRERVHYETSGFAVRRGLRVSLGYSGALLPPRQESPGLNVFGVASKK